ncbi:putative small exonuclease [Pseudomonas phage UAVern]|uniref:Small exonuclease n=1 Tax=Pseudomonas phage UAVern TaxID=2856997 RepID=A0A975UWR7_9CAUD|nr:putative small exonuclease [Pseudomonas phage UAVern]
MDEDILIFDADSIAYKAAAANETKSITTQHITNGTTEHWSNRTEFKKALEGERYDSIEMYTITDVQDPRHSSYGKSLIKEMIKGYHNRTGVLKGEIYIGGKDNFRDLIPLPMEHLVTVGKYAGSATLGGRYKGKRDDTIRPVQLKELRQWMIDELGAIVVNGMEVDDKGSIRAYEGWKAKKGRVIQVTEDKDALQCSGWLFNPAKHSQPVLIQGFGELHREGKGIKGTGRLWLYFQSVYGDKVDCYHGSDLWKIDGDRNGIARQYGEVAAFNLLKDATNDKEALAAVYKQYQEWYPEPVTYTAHDGVVHTKDALQIMQMYVDCAFMRRWDDDRIDVPAMLGKLGVI